MNNSGNKKEEIAGGCASAVEVAEEKSAHEKWRREALLEHIESVYRSWYTGDRYDYKGRIERVVLDELSAFLMRENIASLEELKEIEQRVKAEEEEAEE